jgi:hypothetical protein
MLTSTGQPAHRTHKRRSEHTQLRANDDARNRCLLSRATGGAAHDQLMSEFHGEFMKKGDWDLPVHAHSFLSKRKAMQTCAASEQGPYIT